MIYLQLMYEFFLTGLLAVGGGMATVPFLVRMGQHHPEWFSYTELVNMMAVSESTPGPMGINMASYVGYTVGGIPGAILAPLSLVFPSVVIVIVIAKALQKYMESSVVKRCFASLRAAVVGLISAAGWTVLSAALFHSGTADLSSRSAFVTNLNFGALILFVVCFALTQEKHIKKLHPVVFIVVGAVAGILFQL